MQTQHLLHRSGGRITAIYYAEHETDRGAAFWHFRGDVEWSDGKKSAGLAIGPNQICSDDSPESKAECDMVLEQMTAHLNNNGKWHDLKFTKDDVGYSWTPRKPKGRTVVYHPAAALAPAGCSL